MGYRSSLLIFITALLLCPLSHCYGSAWTELWNNVGNAVNNYNENMLATGDSVNQAIAEKDPNAAFENYVSGIQKTGDDALADSKAVGQALKALLDTIPKAIKALWDEFIDAITAIKLWFLQGQEEGSSAPPAEEPPAEEPPAEEPPAEEPPAEEPPAEEPPAEEEPPATEEATEQAQPSAEEAEAPGPVEVKASSTLSSFLLAFKESNDFEAKLRTYVVYKENFSAIIDTVSGLKEEEKSALQARVDFLSRELSTMEQIMEDEIGEALATNDTAPIFLPLEQLLRSHASELKGLGRVALRAVNHHRLEGNELSDDLKVFVESFGSK